MANIERDLYYEIRNWHWISQSERNERSAKEVR